MDNLQSFYVLDTTDQACVEQMLSEAVGGNVPLSFHSHVLPTQARAESWHSRHGSKASFVAVCVLSDAAALALESLIANMDQRAARIDMLRADYQTCRPTQLPCIERELEKATRHYQSVQEPYNQAVSEAVNAGECYWVVFTPPALTQERDSSAEGEVIHAVPR